MNLSILIHTFNKYQFLWPGSLKGWEWVYHEPVDFYWGTDTKSHREHDFNKFKVLYSGENEWSDRLLNLLNQVKTDYVLYAQEDHWPTAKPPYFSDLMEIVTKYGLKRMQISPIVQFYSLYGSEVPFFFHEQAKSKYLVCHQPSIWERKFLISCLKNGETPWVNEYAGTCRLWKNPVEIRRKIAIYPHSWYHHACIGGKLVLPSAK